MPSAALLSRRLPAGWVRMPVRDAVKLISNVVKVAPDAEYKMAGVKWYGEGLFHRETVRGDSHYAQVPLARGSLTRLIYNRLFAWKASFAVVPGDLSDCHVSSDFPQFTVNPTKLLPEYLYLWCTTNQTIKAANAASTGSAAVSRNCFREEFFLDFKIPIPPLSQQRKIVAAWEQARKYAATAAAKIEQLERDIEATFPGRPGLESARRSDPR